MKAHLIGLLSLLLLVNCKQDEIIFFEGKDAMGIYVAEYEPDSTVYSFAYSLPDVIRDTILLTVRLQGAASTKDREIVFQAIEGTTAVEGEDYVLPVFSFPAGTLEIRYPVILLRNESLKEETKSLLVSIKPNMYFEKGALGQEIGKSYSIDHYVIHFNDFLSQPSYWTGIQSLVGEFSVTKLQFMFSVYGVDKDFGSMTTGERLNMRLRLRAALASYVALNGPLIDENENEVTF